MARLTGAGASSLLDAGALTRRGAAVVLIAGRERRPRPVRPCGRTRGEDGASITEGANGKGDPCGN